MWLEEGTNGQYEGSDTVLRAGTAQRGDAHLVVGGEDARG
jgi:hypothetical protein